MKKSIQKKIEKKIVTKELRKTPITIDFNNQTIGFSKQRKSGRSRIRNSSSFNFP